MKKRIFAVLMTAMMTVSMAVTAFAADIESDLIGKFKFDGNLTNEVGGEGTAVLKGLAAGEGDASVFTYVDGVDGSAIYMNKDGDTTGVNLNICPKDGGTYTISVWAKALGCNFANPIVWAGKNTQSPECWVGIWPGLAGDYANGPALGSNDEAGNRYGITPTKPAGIEGALGTFEWMNITIVVEKLDGNIVGSLYYNGTLVGLTIDGVNLPDIVALGDDTVSVYLGANTWDPPFNGYVDNLYVYDRALTGEDVKALVEATNVNKVTLAEFPESEGRKTTIDYTKKPVVGGNDSWTVEKEPESEFPVAAVIGVAVAVVLVVAIVLVLVISKSKKKAGNDSEV